MIMIFLNISLRSNLELVVVVLPRPSGRSFCITSPTTCGWQLTRLPLRFGAMLGSTGTPLLLFLLRGGIRVKGLGKICQCRCLCTETSVHHFFGETSAAFADSLCITLLPAQ